MINKIALKNPDETYNIQEIGVLSKNVKLEGSESLEEKLATIDEKAIKKHNAPNDVYGAASHTEYGHIKMGDNLDIDGQGRLIVKCAEDGAESPGYPVAANDSRLKKQELKSLIINGTTYNGTEEVIINTEYSFSPIAISDDKTTIDFKIPKDMFEEKFENKFVQWTFYGDECCICTVTTILSTTALNVSRLMSDIYNVATVMVSVRSANIQLTKTEDGNDYILQVNIITDMTKQQIGGGTFFRLIGKVIN